MMGRLSTWRAAKVWCGGQRAIPRIATSLNQHKKRKPTLRIPEEYEESIRMVHSCLHHHVGLENQTHNFVLQSLTNQAVDHYDGTVMMEENGTLERKMSVKETFKGKRVFLTGVTGYVGSLVLEQLLRVCPDVDTVFVLIRGKKNLTSKQRLEKLLSSGLFNMLWDRAGAFSKIQLIEGDITQDNLGIHKDDLQDVLRSTNIVIHSAAAVALDDPIKKTLHNNYISTMRVLELCKKMINLHAYAHVSTAYANINFERGSVVKEKIFPLFLGDNAVKHSEVVSDFMKLTDEEAQLKAEVFMERFNYPNTYCVGKRVTEELVADYYARGLPCCIIRPSLIAGVRGDPYPGYIGNLAGGAGYAIAFAVGFFEENSAAWEGSGVVDGVPGDVVSSVILAAAASTATTRVKEDEIAVFHACSSCTSPLTNSEMYRIAGWFLTKEPPPYCLLWGPYPVFPVTYKPNWFLVAYAMTKTAIKVYLVTFLLRFLRRDRLASRIYTGWRAWVFGNKSRYDMNLFFSVDNVRAMESMLVDDEKEEIKLLVTPETHCWFRYIRTFIAGLKSLYLKAEVKDFSDHDFRPIPSRVPPITLPSSVERRPSQCLKPEDVATAEVIIRRKSSTITADSMGLSTQPTLATKGGVVDSDEDPQLSDAHSPVGSVNLVELNVSENGSVLSSKDKEQGKDKNL